MPTQPLPPKVLDRLSATLPRYQSIVNHARSRDVGEADTVTIVKDILSDVFGYEKYTDLTSEFSIRGTYVDLAIKMDTTVQALVEVKSIGSALKDHHAKQAVDYAANQGVDWVILTNGQIWRIYHIVFAKPISAELLVEIDLCKINHKSADDLEPLYLWCKEGWKKSVLGQYKDRKQALSKFIIGEILFSEPVLSAIRRELKRLTPDIKIESEQIASVMMEDVVKREVMESLSVKHPTAPNDDNKVSSEDQGKTRQRRKRIDVFVSDLAPGEELVFVSQPDLRVQVTEDKKVNWNGDCISLSDATVAAYAKVGISNPPSPFLAWSLNGEVLEVLRHRKSQETVQGDNSSTEQRENTDSPTP